MNIDDLKKKIKHRQSKKQSESSTEREGDVMEFFMNNMKWQDKEDKKYLIRQRLIPLLIGLLSMTFLIFFMPFKNTFLAAGTITITGTLIITLVLHYLDFRKISQESFDLNLFQFLDQKEKRLKSWRVTHYKYTLIFILYQIGLLMMILGNKPLVNTFSTLQLLVFIGCIFAIISISWCLSEHFFRKRHKKKHQPLLEIINQLKEELEKD
jgi:hypothetical protein